MISVEGGVDMVTENNLDKKNYDDQVIDAVHKLNIKEARRIILNILVGTKDRDFERYKEVIKITEEVVFAKLKK